MHNMHLALATRDDALALADLFAMTGLSPDQGPIGDAAAQARWDAAREALPGSHVVVGRRCDGTVMGALTVVLPSSPDGAEKSCATLEDLAVHPVMQRCGLGRQLVQQAMALAQQAGSQQLALSPSPHHANAQAFYERLGFEQQDAGLSVLRSMPD